MHITIGIKNEAAARDILGQVADCRIRRRLSLAELDFERLDVLGATLDILQPQIGPLGDCRLQDRHHCSGELRIERPPAILILIDCHASFLQRSVAVAAESGPARFVPVVLAFAEFAPRSHECPALIECSPTPISALGL